MDNTGRSSWQPREARGDDERDAPIRGGPAGARVGAPAPIRTWMQRSAAHGCAGCATPDWSPSPIGSRRRHNRVWSHVNGLPRSDVTLTLVKICFGCDGPRLESGRDVKTLGVLVGGRGDGCVHRARRRTRHRRSRHGLRRRRWFDQSVGRARLVPILSRVVGAQRRCYRRSGHLDGSGDGSVVHQALGGKVAGRCRIRRLDLARPAQQGDHPAAARRRR
jgi:hypothetical protein